MENYFKVSAFSSNDYFIMEPIFKQVPCYRHDRDLAFLLSFVIIAYQKYMLNKYMHSCIIQILN